MSLSRTNQHRQLQHPPHGLVFKAQVSLVIRGGRLAVVQAETTGHSHKPNMRAGEALDNLRKTTLFDQISRLLGVEPSCLSHGFSGHSSSCRSTRNRKTLTSQMIVFLASRFS